MKYPTNTGSARKMNGAVCMAGIITIIRWSGWRTKILPASHPSLSEGWVSEMADGGARGYFPVRIVIDGEDAIGGGIVTAIVTGPMIRLLSNPIQIMILRKRLHPHYRILPKRRRPQHRAEPAVLPR